MAAVSGYVSATALDEKSYRRRVNAWTLYDWANSAFVTTVMAAVLPVYFSSVAGSTLPSAAAATSLWSMGLSLSLLIAALISPILGTISDVARNKKPLLAIFVGMGVIATALMVLIGEGDWLLASALVIFGRIGLNGANVFYDALLPHVARPDDQDRVSSLGYAMGYLGGGLLLAVNVVMIFVIPDFPGFEFAGTRLSFFSVAVWWFVFTLPLFFRIPEPPAATATLAPGETVVGVSFKRLRATFSDLRGYSELFKLLVAFLIYNDGIGTIISVATIYGAELGFGTIELILALLLVQFVGIPFSIIFGRLPDRQTTWRPFFVAFVLFNVVMLPVVAISGRFLLPADQSGVRQPPFVSTGIAVGQGEYLATDAEAFDYSGNWDDVVVPAEALSGTGVLRVVNAVFGETLTDVTYRQTTGVGDTASVVYNGQEATITYSVGPDHGVWEVLLDGEPVFEDGEQVLIDANYPTVRYGDDLTVTAPEAGEHTLTLVNTGEGGNVMAVAGVAVAEPARESNLALVIGLVFAVQLVGLVFAWLVGKPLYAVLDRLTKIDARLDTKQAVIAALLVYMVIAVWGYFIDSTVEFWFLAWMVAIVQGGSQALSRSLYSSMSPAAKSGEFFGLFGVMEKFSAIMGPILFALAALIFGSSRPAILSLIAFFVIGIWLLNRVDVAEGQRVAREEDAATLGTAAAGD